MKLSIRNLFLLFYLPAFLLAGSISGREVSNFNLFDMHDKDHELYRVKGKAVVLFFTGTGCPIARKSVATLKKLDQKYASQGVDFWIINSYADESLKDMRDEIRKLRIRGMTYLRDLNQSVALAYGVNRTAEVIAIDTFSWETFYQGALDDQFSEGAEKPKATELFLKNALDQFLAGEAVSKPSTRSRGCRIAFERVGGESGVPDYASQVVPILKDKCVNCHRDGGIGPWNMTSHRRVRNYSDMIEEVVLTRRMPPWDPHPDYGHFKSDAGLTREQSQTLLSWVKAGSPKGDGPDPLTEPLPALPDWRLGKPDVVMALPEVQHIKATGIEPYRHLVIENPFDEDVWIEGMDFKPGNPKVVHHAILYAKWPGAPRGDKKGVFFYGWAPGSSTLKYPKGVAKKLPANATLTMEMHYTTNGEPQTDLSEMSFYVADGPQPRNGETRSAIDQSLDIPPGLEDARHVATYNFKKNATIYGLFPHMHFRGKWMRYELMTPDGKKKTLLHVPKYDFQWQLSYYPEEPIRVPAGSWLMVTGSFDNSAANPANPDYKKRVFFGQQTWDEMFIGFFEAADDPEEPPLAMVK